ncbi:outer membrane protein assembly factor BamE domain-containing protein [Blastomonas sp. SL216]|uniref:outer membrane protein assembly factor BamE domain-containing protein n=1 Tax=Blastomonas sp. SL216 TaxID=2995169 RepID=UPI0023771285|nr:outer membrane protein assembly factor BamE [Blastomonas sp. SL216]
MKCYHQLIVAILLIVYPKPSFAEAGDSMISHGPHLDQSVHFPDPKRASRRSGVITTPSNIVMITPGARTDDVYKLLGVPHFYEGFSVSHWNYLVNIYQGPGVAHVQCQFQVVFDKKRRVTATYINSKQCYEIISSKENYNQ